MKLREILKPKIIILVLIITAFIIALISMFTNKKEEVKVTQYAGKVEHALAGTIYKSANSVIEITLEGTDSNYKSNSLTAANIIVKVGGTAVTPTKKTLSTPTAITNGVQYKLTLQGVPGNGALSIDVQANTLTDKAENKNIIKTFTTSVVMDNVAPTISSFSLPTTSAPAESQKGALLINLDGVNNTGSGHSASATTWKNLVGGTSKDGTINGATWVADGLSFDGTNDWVNLGEITNNTEDIEVTFTPYKVETSANQYIIGNWENGGGGVYIQDGKIKVSLALRGQTQDLGTAFAEYKILQSTTSLSNGKKYTVLLKFTGDSFQLYVNGVLEAELTPKIRGYILKSDADTNMVLGGNPSGSSISGEYFKGTIHSAKVWDDYIVVRKKTKTSITMITKASDNASGLSRYEYYCDGVIKNTVTTSQQKTQNVYGDLTIFKSYTLKVRVYDVAGNYSESTVNEAVDDFVQVENITRDGYDLYAYTSKTGITALKFPTWTRYKDQDDIRWEYATKQEDKIWHFRVNVSDHNYEAGLYASHCYYDTASAVNTFIDGVDVQVPTTNYQCVKNIGRAGYDLYYYNNLSTINRVQFPSWTAYNGQDEIRWYEVANNGNGGYHQRVLSSEHKFESGLYYSHIYHVINEKQYGAGKYEDIIVPSTEMYYVEAVTSSGYYVTAWTNRTGISEMNIATWTESGGQDDVRWTRATHLGNGVYQVRVNVSDHGYQNGKYLNHIYAVINGTNTFLAGPDAVVTGASPPAGHSHNFNAHCNTLHNGVAWSCTCGGYHYSYYHIVCSVCGAQSGVWTCPNGPLGGGMNVP